jgi:hypothetical protein
MEREYKRMGLPSRSFRFTDINKEYKLCNSYPQVLCVPCSTSDADLQAGTLPSHFVVICPTLV